MKEMDCVEVSVEKEKNAREGVHKGMQGWICHPEYIQGYWLVNFPRYGARGDIATIPIKEDELTPISAMDATVNERIRSQFEE